MRYTVVGVLNSVRIVVFVAMFSCAGCVSDESKDKPGAYRIDAIRYATIQGFPKSAFVQGATAGETVDAAMMFWLLRGEGRTILVDSGFYRQRWFEYPGLTDYLRPDSAIRLAGVSADAVTDIIITHVHWDHVGGLDLFPNATVWIQADEYDYYTGIASQGQDTAELGVDPLDVQNLVEYNRVDRLQQVNGDNIEILPGIRVFTGARHTYASQYVLVEGDDDIILASDNCGLYENAETLQAIGMLFSPEDTENNIAALSRMNMLAGDSRRVIPGHDFEVFQRYRSKGRIARIR